MLYCMLRSKRSNQEASQSRQRLARQQLVGRGSSRAQLYNRVAAVHIAAERNLKNLLASQLRLT
jgi:hypothetical protein